MNKVDSYINSVYRDFDGNHEEIEMLKKEMRDHLFQSVRDLKLEGKSEEESMNIAIKRFGEVNQLKKELIDIYGFHNKFQRVIFILSMVLLTISILLNFSRGAINAYGGNVRRSMVEKVSNVIIQSNGNITKGQLNSLFDQNKLKFNLINADLKYIAIYRYPKNYKGDFDSVSFKNAKYIYPSTETLNNDLSRFGYIGNAGLGKEITSNGYRWYISIVYMNPGVVYGMDYIFKLLMVASLSAYWVLFGVWASIKLYYFTGKYNKSWIIVFFIFNIVGYILFKIKWTMSKAKQNI
jgi:hypothetical protein